MRVPGLLGDVTGYVRLRTHVLRFLGFAPDFPVPSLPLFLMRLFFWVPLNHKEYFALFQKARRYFEF